MQHIQNVVSKFIIAMSEDCGIIEVYVLKYHPNDSFIKFVRKDFLLYPVTFL